jgi:hypothetical protein
MGCFPDARGFSYACRHRLAHAANRYGRPRPDFYSDQRPTQTYHTATVGFEVDYPKGWLIDTTDEAWDSVIL